MRFADILALACSALWQQKVRTLLTTLGVVLGTFVLTASVSINRGVQETIVREYSKHGGLRRIHVHAIYEHVQAPKDTVVEGNMSEAKRARLRKVIGRREHFGPRQTQRVALTPERLRAIGQLDHVSRVVPVVHQAGRVSYRDKRVDALAVGVPADHKLLKPRLEAGTIPEQPDGRHALVSEYLLYQLGVTDDADVPGVLGKTVRVEFVHDIHRPNVLLNLVGASFQRKLDPKDQDLLDRVIKKLPEAFTKLDLSPAELAQLQRLLEPPKEKPKREEETVAADFMIAGVVQAVSPEDERGPHDWWLFEADLLLPIKTAEELYFRSAANRDEGASSAIVEADSTDHVKELTDKIKDMGFRVWSAVDFLDAERLMFLIIFGAMTLVAVVALLVAALGIINTMLISILERTREVGIMKAVGARDRHIQLIFLVEGALIGLLGGLLGLLLAWCASLPGDAWLRGLVLHLRNVHLEESILVFPWWLVMGAPLFACLVTTTAAVYPAWRAARLNPVTALRHE